MINFASCHNIFCRSTREQPVHALLFLMKKEILFLLLKKNSHKYFRKPGWVEHDALEIWSTQLGTAAEAITKAGLNCK